MIANRRQLIECLLDMPDKVDFAGNVVPSNIVVEDEEGVMYMIDDFYMTGEDYSKLKIRRLR